MIDDLLATQAAYYQARAPIYEHDLYDSDDVQSLMGTVVERVPPGAEVLELACGPGVWTERLVPRAKSVTAVDGAAEMLRIAREREPGADYQVVDLFAWQPDRRYDVVFFGFWLSHVPAGRFAAFWRMVASALRDDGVVVFVDEHVCAAEKETWAEHQVALRSLPDGSTYRIVKRYLEPDSLQAVLTGMGWRADVHALGSGWVLGTAAAPRRANAGSP